MVESDQVSAQLVLFPSAARMHELVYAGAAEAWLTTAPIAHATARAAHVLRVDIPPSC
jgi:hypothetical protein